MEEQPLVSRLALRSGVVGSREGGGRRMQTRISDKKKAARHLLLDIYRTAVKRSVIFSDCSIRYTPVYPFPQKDVKTGPIGCVLGVSSRTFVLQVRLQHLVADGSPKTENRKSFLLPFGNEVGKDIFPKAGFWKIKITGYRQHPRLASQTPTLNFMISI